MQDESDHPGLELIEHWKTSFAYQAKQKSGSKQCFVVGTKMAVPSMRATFPPDERHSRTLWHGIDSNMIGGQPKRYAYTTLLTRASYLPGVIVLAYTLRKHGSRHPLVVLYTPTLAASAVRVLEEEAQTLDIVPRLCEHFLPLGHNQMRLIAERFADTWTKLRAFELYDYEAVCYLDADMSVFNGNMDEIFLHLEHMPPDHIVANHVCCCNLDNDSWAPSDWNQENCAYTPLSHPSALSKSTPVRPESRRTHQLLNGGLFLYRPTREQWDSLMNFCRDHSEKLQHYMFPDQDLLADFFRQRWSSVGWQWNALKTMRYWHPDMWRDSEVRCLHYIVDKPWAARIRADGRAGYKGRDGETHRWWWNEYFEWYEQSRQCQKSDVIATVEENIGRANG